MCVLNGDSFLCILLIWQYCMVVPLLCLEEGDLSVYGRGDEVLHVAPPKKMETDRENGSGN